MNKNIIIALALVIAIGGGYFYITTTMGSDGKGSVTTDTLHVGAEEGDFVIQEGSSVSYAAQKVFFSKPTLEVIGTNTFVSGAISVDESRNSVSVRAAIDPKQFKTDNANRDRDVANMFNGPIVVQGTDITADNVQGNETSFSGMVLLSVTINDITKIVPFTVVAALEGDTITASGSSEVVMSDFGITPPSLLNVYTVEDALGLSFSIRASR